MKDENIYLIDSLKAKEARVVMLSISEGFKCDYRGLKHMKLIQTFLPTELAVNKSGSGFRHE